MDSEGGKDTEIVDVVIGFKSGDRITLGFVGKENAKQSIRDISDAMRRPEQCNVILINDMSIRQYDISFILPKAALRPGEEAHPCTPNSSSPPAGYTALAPSDLTDLVAAYLVTDLMPVKAKEVSEGFLRDMLRRTNGMGGNEVRALWFDAVERGNRLIERYLSERDSLDPPSKELPTSGESPADR